MKPPVERELNTKLTVNGSAALDQFMSRNDLNQIDAVNVLIQAANFIHEELGFDSELLIRRPDGSISKINIRIDGVRWGR